MAPIQERLWLDAFSDVLERSHLFQPDELAPAVAAVMSRLGIRTTLYLVDDEQRALRIIPYDGQPPSPPLALDDTVAGRAFRLVQSAPHDGERGWWVPVINGTDRLGVIEYTFADGVDTHDELLLRRCETMAGLIGHLITVTAPKGDFLHQVRRTRPMSPSAELLNQMLPPLTVSCERLTISAMLEPRYDVGGDGFDYALDGPLARMVIFDGVGHGLRAGLAYTVAMVAIRAARRAGHNLQAQAGAADVALRQQFGAEARFVTAVLTELDMDTGMLRYLIAGHPAPLLLRGGTFIKELGAHRRTPLGVAHDDTPIGEEMLQPGDRLLLYTDGITEARDFDGNMFGLQRLIEHAQHHAAEALPAPETLRRLAQTVAEFHDGPATDDATLLLAEWSPNRPQVLGRIVS